MKKQTQEQFLKTIDRLLEKLAEREAECLKLREALEEFPTSFHTLPKDESCKCSQCQAIRGKQKALSTPPSTFYLEQWVKENFEVAAWKYPEAGYIAYQGKPPTQRQIDFLAKWKRPAWLPLYARKD